MAAPAPGTIRQPPRRAPWIVAAVVLAALALVAWVAAGPWLAIRGIERAIAQRDTAALERHVDFPRLRVNLKAQLDDRMVRAAGQDIASNPLGAIALAMAGGATGVAVDTLATPLGIGALLQGHVLWQRAGGRTVGGDTWAPTEPASRAAAVAKSAAAVAVSAVAEATAWCARAPSTPSVATAAVKASTSLCGT